MNRVLHIANTVRSFFSSAHAPEDEQSAQLRAIYESAPIGITLNDLQGRYIRANTTYQRMLGFGEDELRLRTSASLIHPEDYQRYLEQLQELLRGERKAFRLVMRYRTRSGVFRWIRSTVSLLNEEYTAPRCIVTRYEDITDSWLRQQCLRDRIEPLQLLVACVTEYAIFILDTEGYIRSWNAGAEHIYDYLEDDIIGRHVSCLYSHENKEQDNPGKNLQIAETEGRFEEEDWRVRKDGTAIWVNVIITPMRDEAGNLRGYAKVTRDLTARRQLEVQLRESEARLQAFLNHSPSVIFMKDIDGRYLHVNSRFLQSFNIAEEQVIGKKDAEIFAPDQAAAFTANDREVFRQGVPLQFEEKAQYIDGPRINTVSKFPIRDRAGMLVGIGGIATDITDYRRAQDALRLSEQSFSELVENLPIAVYVCDADGCIVSYNRSAVEMWGRTPKLGDYADRYCGSYRLYTTDGAYIPHAECPVKDVLETGRSVSDCEVVIERPDGSRRIALANIIPRRDNDGTLAGVINCMMDITERIQAEHDMHDYTEQLRVLSQRLVELHEDDRLTLSRELHDRVGQNLTALSINIGIVLDQFPDELRHLVAPRLNDSQELVKATVDCITDVMADLRPPLLDDYGLLPALQSISDKFKARSGIEVTVLGPKQLERLHIQAEVSLCRIAQEALTNLVKHAHARHVKIELMQDFNQTSLTITDDGMGFDPKLLAEQSIPAGWGMFTMRERAVALGGTLSVESRPGHGTQVLVTIPR